MVDKYQLQQENHFKFVFDKKEEKTIEHHRRGSEGKVEQNSQNAKQFVIFFQIMTVFN